MSSAIVVLGQLICSLERRCEGKTSLMSYLSPMTSNAIAMSHVAAMVQRACSTAGCRCFKHPLILGLVFEVMAMWKSLNMPVRQRHSRIPTEWLRNGGKNVIRNGGKCLRSLGPKGFRIFGSLWGSLPKVFRLIGSKRFSIGGGLWRRCRLR
jgi:hypothetical protein